MVLYARDVLTGELSGPYSDEDAERFACLALLDRRTAEHAGCSDARLAEMLGLPLDEVSAFLAEGFEHRPPAPRSAPRARLRRRSLGCGA